MINGKSNIIIIPMFDYYLIYHGTSGTSWTVSNCPTLIEIIKMNNAYFDVIRRKGGRYDARLTIWNGKVIARPYLSRIAYDCYYNGLTADKLESYYNTKDTSRSSDSNYPTIDHLDGNSQNNRRENVFEMTREENKRKYQKPQKMKVSRCITLANDKGRCKIQYAYIDYKGRIRVLRYICWDSRSLNNCLDYINANKLKIANERRGILINDTTDYDIMMKRFSFGIMTCSMRPTNSQALAAKIARIPDNMFSPVTNNDTTG